MGKNINEIKFSVIIPAYNAEKTIYRALKSVINQTCVNCISEIIVIDDGSTDETNSIVEQFKADNKEFNIKLYNKKNGGVSSARNLGLEKATGNWIALLDSDDEWLDNKLEKQIKVIENNCNIDFLGCNHTDEIVRIGGRPINKLYKATVKDLCVKMFPQTSTAIFKKEIFNKIGGYDESRSYCEDGQFFLKICEKYNYYYMPEKLIVYDGGRRGFGVSGLSGDIYEMQKGVMKNLKELRQRKAISISFYLLMIVFYQLKYIRRILICKMEKFETNK